jgi:hypothetical protein
MGNRLAKLAVAAAGFYLVVKRLGTRWGATNAEVDGSLPGDEVIPHPRLETTHAVTINAPPAAVWPWLVQAGFGRGGWYSDSALDPLIFAVIGAMTPKEGRVSEAPKSATRILPEHQHIAIDDIIPDGPPGTAWFRVVSFEPNRSLVLYSDSHPRFMTPAFLHKTRWASSGEFTWNFILRPLPNDRTRFILRTRLNLLPRALLTVGAPLWYLGDFLQARAVLLGFKKRAEARRHEPLPVAAANPATPDMITH